jgi:altronate dehydratase
MPLLSGYRRITGHVGARNHLVIIPSVVCSNLVCRQIAAEQAIALEHQHGCAEVGADVDQTAAALAGAAANPNVGAALIVGLGCETVQAAEVAEKARSAGGHVEVLSIQGCGGTAATVEAGRTMRDRLLAMISEQRRDPVAAREITVGLDSVGTIAQAIREACACAGIRAIGPSDSGGPAAHTKLAQDGAQVIISLAGPDDAPAGFAICPTITVGCASALHHAMRDDFDDAGTGEPEEIAARVLALTMNVFSGALTAAERRGSRQFIMRRLMRTL